MKVSNPRHVASGIAAVTDSANVTPVNNWVDVWVDSDDLSEALRVANDMAGEVGVDYCDVTGSYAIRLRC